MFTLILLGNNGIIHNLSVEKKQS